MKWILKRFDELTVHELYAVLQLRNDVFVVEQNCVYQDLDDKDQHCWHLVCFNNEIPVAYTRILPPGIIYENPSIGRVVTSRSFRKKGLGRELMKNSISAVEKLFGKQPITLGAQLYLKEFYISLGFIAHGEIYIEDGIQHITMTRKASS